MAKKKLHSFSVIVAAFNEEKYLADCIRALKQQDYPGEFEIIVVDNGSSDKTAEIGRGLGAKVVFEPRRGVSHALIAGCKSAQGEIFAFTDADTRPPKTWLRQLNQAFNSGPNVAAVGGPFYFYDSPKWANAVMKNIVVKNYIKFFHEKKRGLPGSNMSVRAEVYRKAGGFIPGHNWGQDWQMGGRASKFGEVIFDPRIVVFTSFRRFRGNHKHPVLASARAIKEISVGLARMVPLTYFNKNLKPQKPIR